MTRRGLFQQHLLGADVVRPRDPDNSSALRCSLSVACGPPFMGTQCAVLDPVQVQDRGAELDLAPAEFAGFGRPQPMQRYLKEPIRAPRGLRL
jgi:hypothetical protein